MLNKISMLAASAAVLALATTSANAAVFNQGSFALTGFVNLSGSSNNVTTTPLDIDLTSSTVNIGSPTGDFDPVVGSSVMSLVLTNGASLTFNTTNAADFNFASTLLGTFTASTVTENGAGCGSTGPNTVCYSIFGAFTPGSSYTNSGSLVPGGADEIWTLNQTGGAGQSISFSATFNSPAVTTNVPEPITISLFGAGLAGLGFGSRRRKAAAKA
jgi:hypothetical protein